MATSVKIPDTTSTIKAVYLPISEFSEFYVSEDTPGTYTLYGKRISTSYAHVVGGGYTDVQKAEGALRSLIDGESVLD